MTRPVIGVTVSNRSGWRIFPLMALNVWLAGGRPVRWQSAEAVDVGAADGVIIGGGDDISPTLYGGELVTEARIDPARDAMEKAIVEQAMTQGTPLLGICRGSQMLNVALGGTLDQNAYATYRSRHFKTVLPRKRVSICPDSRLSMIAGLAEMKVNALHSQSVDRLGQGVRVAARDEGGMIQAIERIRDPFALGVQWHPEHLFYAHRQRALFKALVAAARACRDGRAQTAGVDSEFA
jgi:putative glutamine amidotransferase